MQKPSRATNSASNKFQHPFIKKSDSNKTNIKK